MLHSIVLAVVVGSLPLAPVPASPGDSLRPDHEVRLVALRHAAEIRHCYETQGLRVNPQLRGMVEVEVTVLPSGIVNGANISASGLAGAGRAAVEACITTSVKNWRYERGPFVTETIVYPFTLVRDANTAVSTAMRRQPPGDSARAGD
ncbi:MAG TPA: AgmX/PglI C-terminal domain-containing protein [Gemmatimonadaceae bacterium]|nr:AgmX/PglI C-terminal domain-containing protein [Gemmatimonadaceae bacterium]